jgi:hypothetical protein
MQIPRLDVASYVQDQAIQASWCRGLVLPLATTYCQSVWRASRGEHSIALSRHGNMHVGVAHAAALCLPFIPDLPFTTPYCATMGRI